MRWVRLLAVCTALTGCAGQSQMSWMHADGREVDDAFLPAMDQCRDVADRVGEASPEPQREELMQAAMRGCMARHGYVWRCQHPLASPLDGGCFEL